MYPSLFHVTVSFQKNLKTSLRRKSRFMIGIVKIIYRPQFVLSRIAKKTIVTKKCTARKHAKPVQVSDIFFYFVTFAAFDHRNLTVLTLLKL